MVVLLVFAITGMMSKQHTVRYDCSISEISPDFPQKVKEECRKLKAK